MRFCIYLTRRGLLTSTQCVQVLAAVVDGTPPFGRLAIRERAMSIQQLAALLHSVPDPTVPMGELAIQAGLMDEETRTRLLQLQRRETPTERAVLVALELLTADVVEREYQRFLGKM